MTAKRILAYGEDSLVISTRAMILQRAGYDVAHTTCAADLVPLLHGIHFDLVLIGDSLRTPETVRVAQKLRSQFPSLTLVMVQDDREERDSCSTAFVNSSPEQVLKAIHHLLDARKPAVATVARGIKAMHAAAGH